jgi:predicted unusual protein kinase regulating ubiquinone biosynthesis (AarF/ABC1/UbiB family)
LSYFSQSDITSKALDSIPVPAYYALILRSLTVLEGLALYADPDFKVLAASYPYFAKRLLTDPNPYLRDALIELLFKDGRFRQVPAHLYIF